MRYRRPLGRAAPSCRRPRTAHALISAAPSREAPRPTGACAGDRSTQYGRTRTPRPWSARRNARTVQALVALRVDARRSSRRHAPGSRGRTRPWCPAIALDGVERCLVREVPVAGRHRALVDDVVDAPHDAVRGGLALGQAHERLHLLGKPVARGQHGKLPAEVFRVPRAACCRTARPPRRRGCGRWRARRSRRPRAASSNRWRFDSPHAEQGTRRVAARRGRHVVAVVSAQIDRDELQPLAGRRTRRAYSWLSSL